MPYWVYSIYSIYLLYLLYLITLLYLFYLIHLIYTSRPQRFAFLWEGPCVCVCPAIYMQVIFYSLDERWNSSERERMRQAMLHELSLWVNSMHIKAGELTFVFNWNCVIVSMFRRHELAQASPYRAWVLLYAYLHGLQFSGSPSPLVTWPRMVVLRAFSILTIKHTELNSNYYDVWSTWAIWSPCFTSPIWSPCSTCSIWSTWSTRLGLKDLPSFGKARVCVYPVIYMQELSYSLDKSKRWNSSERQRIRQAFRHYMLLRLNSMHITAMDRNPHKSGACLSCLHSPDSFDGT